MTSAAFAQQHFGNGRDNRGGRGGWDRGADHDNSGGWQPDAGRGVPDNGVIQLGVVDIGRGRAYQVINTRAEVAQIQLCVQRDDLQLIRLDVVLGNGRTLTLAANTYIPNNPNRSCTNWLDLPGNERRVTQVVIAGASDRDFRNPRVVVFGRTQNRPPPHTGRVWSSWNNNQTSCGDGQGPFFKDSQNNQIHIMACPDQKPNGGPIGMSCGNLPRGTLCYGWRYNAQPGFFCSAPNGKTPPNPAYIYSMYQCL